MSALAITVLDHTENDSKDKLITQINANFAAVAAMLKVDGTFTSITTPSIVTVANATVTASSQILITLKTVGGTPQPQKILTITAGTGFTVEAASSGDTSVYNYTIIG